MPNVYGYCRISKGRDKHIYSLEAQRAEIERIYAFKKPEWGNPPLILPPFCDVKQSGRNKSFMKRPMGMELMKRIRRGDFIIVAKTDRAFRNSIDQFRTMELFDGMGVKMYFGDLGLDTSSSMGRAMLTIFVALAQMESDRMGERNKAAAEAKKFLLGNPQAKAPIGWRYQRVGEGRPPKISEDHYAREVAEKMMTMAMRGMSWLEIRQKVHRERWKMPALNRVRHNLWSESYVRKLVLAATYGFPITDVEAQGKIELPQFVMEQGDEPRLPEGTVFPAGTYPAAKPLS